MHGAARLAAALGVVIALTGCDGSGGSPVGPSGPAGLSSPPAPSPPRPPEIRGNITVRSIEPDPGATLTVRDCTIGDSDYHWLCADQLRVTFDVQVDQDIPDAVMTAEFVAGALGCGTAWSSRAALTAGTQATISMHGVDVSTEEGSLRCPLPLETTRMIVRLWRAAAPAAPLLTREFTYNYRFVTP